MPTKIRSSHLVLAALGVALAAALLIFAPGLIVGASPSSTIVGGLIGADATWTSGDSPVIVTSSLLVQQGVTLTIRPGVEVRFDPGLALQVNGELVARGTADTPVVFTSNDPDPAPGDWGFILFTDTSVDAVYDGTGDYVSSSILEHCVIQYAGASNDHALRIHQSGPFTDRCTVGDNHGGGIAASSGSARIMHTTVSENNGRGITIDDGMTTLSGNTVVRNFSGGIAIFGGTAIVSSNTISENEGGGIHVGGGSFTVSNNTIVGNITLGDGAGITVGGGIVTVSGNKIMENLALGSGGGVAITSGTVTLADNVITENTSSNAGGCVFVLSGTAITLSGNTIARNTASDDGGGVWVFGATTMSHNTVSDNTSPTSALYWESVSGTAVNNNLVANDAPYMVYNGLGNTQPDADMEDNWWETEDDAEIQAKIYDWFDDPTRSIVDHIPFLTVPNTSAPVSPPMGLVATGDGNTLTIDLSWDANPEGDIAGYIVHYKTGDADFPYEGTGASEGDSGIDVENVTGATLSGLAPWAAYHVAVTAYDIDGNESWYSRDVEVTLQPGVDTATPYTSGHSPASGDTGVSRDINVTVHVRDDGSGVDQSTILLTVEGVDVTGQAVITGGTGDYTVTYDPASDFDYGQVVDVTVDAGDLAGNSMATDSYSFTVIVPVCLGRPATIIGTPGDDILTGTPGDDVIVGLEGDDVILARAGHDIVCAGPGDDFIRGRRGNDRLYGGRGQDVLAGGPGRDRLFGHRGQDILLGGRGRDSHNCGRGFDFANGGPGTDSAKPNCEVTSNVP